MDFTSGIFKVISGERLRIGRARIHQYQAQGLAPGWIGSTNHRQFDFTITVTDLPRGASWRPPNSNLHIMGPATLYADRSTDPTRFSLVVPYEQTQRVGTGTQRISNVPTFMISGLVRGLFWGVESVLLLDINRGRTRAEWVRLDTSRLADKATGLIKRDMIVISAAVLGGHVNGDPVFCPLWVDIVQADWMYKPFVPGREPEFAPLPLPAPAATATATATEPEVEGGWSPAQAEATGDMAALEFNELLAQSQITFIHLNT